MIWKSPQSITRSPPPVPSPAAKPVTLKVRFVPDFFRREYERPKDDVITNVCIQDSSGNMVWHREHLHSTMGGAHLVFDVYVPETFDKPECVLVSSDGGPWILDTVQIDDQTFKRNIDEFGGNCVYYTSEVVPVFDVTKHQMGMEYYSQYKESVVIIACQLIVTGCAILGATGNLDDVPYFGGGGMLGLFYQKLLQHQVDMVGKTSQSNRMNTSAARLGMLMAVLYTLGMNMEDQFEPEHFLEAFVGFMMAKTALLITEIKSKSKK